MCPYKGDNLTPAPGMCNNNTAIRCPSVKPCSCSHRPAQCSLSALGTNWWGAWGNLWRRILERQKPESPVGCLVFPLSLRRDYYAVHQSQDETKYKIPPLWGRITNRSARWACRDPLARPLYNLKSLGPVALTKRRKGEDNHVCVYGAATKRIKKCQRCKQWHFPTECLREKMGGEMCNKNVVCSE